MLKIRLSMGGVKKRPVYKIVIADSRFPRDGRFIEKVGFFNPLLPKTKKERVKLEVERIKHWISKGAKPTLRVSRILGEAEIFPMPPKGNNPLKAIPKKDRKKKDGQQATEELKKELAAYQDMLSALPDNPSALNHTVQVCDMDSNVVGKLKDAAELWLDELEFDSTPRIRP